MRLRTTLSIFFTGLLLPGWACAQQLTSVVRADDIVKITDKSGRNFTGRIDRISQESLRLVSKNTYRDLPASSIQKIRRKRLENDGNRNGQRTGALIGAGVGLLNAASVCGTHKPECGEASTLGIISLTVIGAMTGGIIDHATTRWDRVFTAESQSASRKLQVRPVIRGERKGFNISVSF